MSTIMCFSVNMGCCVYINEGKKMNLILANGCNITKSDKFKGSEYFLYPLYDPKLADMVILHYVTE